MAKTMQQKAGRSVLRAVRTRFVTWRLIWQLLACGMLIVLVTAMFGWRKSESPGSVFGVDDFEDVNNEGFVNATRPTFFVQNELSKELERLNQLPPRNLDLYPRLKKEHIKIVLYVHNRPQYLKVVVESLSKVEGISETLLIVSHDGTFPEMNAIVRSIRFCQVKQIFAVFSPHVYPNSFPGISPDDCQQQDDKEVKEGCKGDADQFGNYRSKVVSLKHHWWWMMNTVWDGMVENAGFDGHVLFIEEDHYIFPNAYRNIQMLTQLKNTRCLDCYAANLAPLDVKSRGEMIPALFVEKISNVGYAFNRTIWRRLHAHYNDFCTFDEYNWDIAMWTRVFPDVAQDSGFYTLRGPRASASHFGICGLHQGQKKGQPECDDKGFAIPTVFPEDLVLNIDPNWEIRRYSIKGYTKGHKGWGGWGDRRDHQLCVHFSNMYHQPSYQAYMRAGRPG